jgi:hypothetical protein
MEYMNTIKSITKAQLLTELAKYSDIVEIVISIGANTYPIDCVISGSGKVYLESNLQLGRPPKYESDEERKKARREQFKTANDKRRNGKLAKPKT